jgi:hypothetical protein
MKDGRKGDKGVNPNPKTKIDPSSTHFFQTTRERTAHHIIRHRHLVVLQHFFEFYSISTKLSILEQWDSNAIHRRRGRGMQML